MKSVSYKMNIWKGFEMLNSTKSLHSMCLLQTSENTKNIEVLVLH
jgi:hypothetical protein